MADIFIKLLQCRVAKAGLLKIDRIGSGVGVIFYNPTQKKGAGLHILAPYSGSMTPKNPVMYANTAIPYAIQQLEAEGVTPPFSVAIAGGASMLGRENEENSGQKVVMAVRDALAKARLTVKVDQTGGTLVRSMILDLDGGKIKIS